MLDYTKSFMEVQFPVSKVSKEAYKERKANFSQTLTCLGKWWGRKPLVLVRATILGCLLPVSDDPKMDRFVFQELMGMNPNQLKARKNKTVPSRIGMSFDDLSYDEKLAYCMRPEQAGDSIVNWNLVNSHLDTVSHTTVDLVNELSMKRFGHRITVGDAFSGGGSIPFEAARMGCNVYGSDLSPLAALLSWADIHLVGAGPKKADEHHEFLEKVFNKTCEEIDDLDVEKDKNGWISKYYLYCNEIVCPECGYKVPLLPSRIISMDRRTTIELVQRENSFDFNIKMNSPDSVMKNATKGTITSGDVICPHCGMKTSISAIRGGDGSPNLRRWKQSDWKPIASDVLKERLYCIKKVKPVDLNADIRKTMARVETMYVAPDAEDLLREKRVEEYVATHFNEWQAKGYIPSAPIAEGYNTSQIIREKGWMYWHQLYNPRQLMFLGLLMKNIDKMATTREELAASICGINNVANFFSKLSIWDKSPGCEKGAQTFSNQALNTLNNWACRSSFSGYDSFVFSNQNYPVSCDSTIEAKDARAINTLCDVWITDPPYADAVNYDELSEFFLAWDAPLIKKAFPEWYTDSKRALAVRGTGESFNNPMVEIYRNLANHMPDNGMQVVMFTHQDVKVWAELSMILWSAGLQVVSAWCIQTETTSGLKIGNYVQGTVLLLLRKRQSSGVVFQDELFEEIREEVHKMIDSMRAIDERDNPDFNDNDYLLAAYASALKVLTSYSMIEGVDVKYELTKARDASGDSPVTKIINQAKKEAYDYLVPSGIDQYAWTQLKPEERFYIKGFESNLNGDFRNGTFQELARSFGIVEYKDLLGDTKANQVRLKTPEEFKNTLKNGAFDNTLLRHVLLAIYVSLQKNDAQEGRKYLRSRYEEKNEYWMLRSRIGMYLEYLVKARGNANLPMWMDAVEMADILRLAVANDSV